MSKDGPKGDLKNFGVRLGRTVDSEAEKSSRGRKPMNPRGSREHWKDTEYERKIRQEFFCPQLSQKDWHSMTHIERYDYIKMVCERGEMVQAIDPDENDIAEEFANFVYEQGIEDDITMACIDAVFEGGQ